MSDFRGSSAGAARGAGAFLGGGTADASAWRTSLQCTPKRRDNSRIPSFSRSWAFRICSYRLTFDLFGIHPPSRQPKPIWWTLRWGPNQMSVSCLSGAKSEEHTQLS